MPSLPRAQRVVRHAGQVHDEHDRAHHRRELQQVALAQLRLRQGGVGGAEIHRAVGDLVDAAAGADALVVQLDAGALARRLAPTLIDRTGKGGAGAGELRLLGQGRAPREGEDGGGGKKGATVHVRLHGGTPGS
jgi:hypothetical protein